MWHPCALATAGLMQPYLGKEGLNAHPMWLLHDLANRDKHRAIHLVAFGQLIRDLHIGAGSTGITHIAYFETFGSQEIGAEPVPLVAYSRDNRGDGLVFRREFGIWFGPGPLVTGREVVPTLRWLAEYIREVPIKKLAKFI